MSAQTQKRKNKMQQKTFRNIEFPSEQITAEKKILVVGDIMLDKYWKGQALRISPEAPVPVVSIEEQDNRLGAAANVAKNIKSLGAKVTLIGIVGNDEAGLEIKKGLQLTGINNEMIVSESTQTTVKLRIISQSQQIARVDFEKKIYSKDQKKVEKKYAELLESHDLVVFSDYGKGVLQQIKEMIKLGKIYSKKILVDPKGKTWENYAGVDVITPNNKEVTDVIGMMKNDKQLVEQLVSKIKELKIENILVTRSERGMLLVNLEGSRKIRAKKVEVTDVTGAGDTVIATLAVMIASGMSIIDATRWANEAAGRVVSKFGTSTINRKDILTAYER